MGLRAGVVVDLLGIVIADAERQRIVGMISCLDLMAAHVGATLVVETKVVVVEPVPERRGFNILIVISDLPVALGLGAAEGHTQIISFVGTTAVSFARKGRRTGGRIVGIFHTNGD